MQKQNKGFTLIELLAVIVVLTIIMVITTPIIIRTIDDVKREAFKNSIYGIIKASEFNYAQQILKNKQVEEIIWIYQEGMESSFLKENKLEYKGSKPQRGIVTINKKGEVAVVLHNKNWCVLKEYQDREIILKEYTNDEKCKLEGDTNYVLATDNDFEWVKDNGGYNILGEEDKGYFYYKGTDKKVVIPHTIKGNLIINYYKMFKETEVQAVASNNKVVKMSRMFENSLASSLDLSNLNTSSVTNMDYMFSSLQATSLNLSNFDTSKVTSMSYMFYKSKALILDLSNFDTSKVTDMYWMFKDSLATSINLSNFNTSSVENMNGIFYGTQVLTLDLSSFDTSSVINMNGTFCYDGNEGSGTIGGMFEDAKVEKVIVGDNFNTSKVQSFDHMFYNTNINNLNSLLAKMDTSNAVRMSGMFINFSGISLDLSSFDTSKVVNMSNMFRGSQISTFDLSSFDTTSVTNMSHMFMNADASIGYAKTQRDADKFNSSSNKPSNLNFIVK